MTDLNDAYRSTANSLNEAFYGDKGTGRVKREPIGRRVVRYFRLAATSAWGKISLTPAVGDQ